MHAAQRVRMLLGLLVAGDGAEAYRLGQPRRGRLRIHLRFRNGGHLQLARAVAEDVEGEHAGENNDRGDQREEDVADDTEETVHKVLPAFTPSLRGAKRRSNPAFLLRQSWIASLRSQ
jgi:hypothetical protein